MLAGGLLMTGVDLLAQFDVSDSLGYLAGDNNSLLYVVIHD